MRAVASAGGRVVSKMGMWKIGPALAAGNTIVVKPDEHTPLTLLEFARIAQECGLPPGGLNVVPGEGTVVGARLASHPDVRKIAFTGSTAVGREIMRMAAGNIKRLTLELGGKGPNIVGDPLDPATDFGPVISAEAQKGILRYTETGQAEGATLVYGGGVPSGPGSSAASGSSRRSSPTSATT
jgi:acyl-CoA reductase-like NAD-dependent aldehyde dehydrogenase